jgi:Cu(I)/Ag(I) efflux system membrane fusion protein
VEGYVAKLYIKAALENVQKGQPIAALVAPAWLAAEQEYLALLDGQSSQLAEIRNAARERLRVLGIPEETIAQIERERRTQTTSTLRAPMDGVVSELNVREGAALVAGVPIARINGLSSVWVNAEIPESDVSALSSGAEVTASTTAWPGEQFKGHVLGILPQVNEQTRTLAVRISVENPERKLSPGMFATLTFENASTSPELWVPTEALIRTGKRNVVIVARDDGGFAPVNVELGHEREGFTAITSGLEDGQSVVLSGQFLIDSEASLRSALTRLTDSPESAAAESQTYVGVGKVEAISDQEITISHQPIPALQWPAMTMGFGVSSPQLAQGVNVGDQVQFTFARIDDGQFVIHAIEGVKDDGAHHP